MLHGLKTKNFFILVLEDKDKLDRGLYRSSYLERYALDVAIRGYSHFISRKREHGKLTSEYRSPNLPQEGEVRINDFMRAQGIYGRWLAMYLLEPKISLNDLREILKEKKIDTVGMEKFFYPPDRLILEEE